MSIYPFKHRSVQSLGGEFNRIEEGTYESYQCRPDISLSTRYTSRIFNCWGGEGALTLSEYVIYV